jgi:hypothetical protein
MGSILGCDAEISYYGPAARRQTTLEVSAETPNTFNLPGRNTLDFIWRNCLTFDPTICDVLATYDCMTGSHHNFDCQQDLFFNLPR